MKAATLSEARVYVGTYGKYNNGSLFGVAQLFHRIPQGEEVLGNPAFAD